MPSVVVLRASWSISAARGRWLMTTAGWRRTSTARSVGAMTRVGWVLSLAAPHQLAETVAPVSDAAARDRRLKRPCRLRPRSSQAAMPSPNRLSHSRGCAVLPPARRTQGARARSLSTISVLAASSAEEPNSARQLGLAASPPSVPSSLVTAIHRSLPQPSKTFAQGHFGGLRRMKRVLSPGRQQRHAAHLVEKQPPCERLWRWHQ